MAKWSSKNIGAAIFLNQFSTIRSKRGSLKAAIPSAAYQQDSTAVPPTPCVSPPHNLENKTVQPDGDQKKNTRMMRESSL